MSINPYKLKAQETAKALEAQLAAEREEEYNRLFPTPIYKPYTDEELRGIAASNERIPDSDDTIAYIKEWEKECKTQTEFTLSDVIEKRKLLSEEQRHAFVKLFGKGCRAKRKENLDKAIYDVGVCARNYFDNWSIYNQVVFTENEPYCTFFAGQDYSQGVKTIREAFTKGY
jgi:hypothetical protein